jgi:hypothetical protein
MAAKLTNAQSELVHKVARYTSNGSDYSPFGPEWQVFYRLKRAGFMDYRGNSRLYIVATDEGKRAIGAAP